MASPVQLPQLVDVPLSLFGGMHTGVAPADLPEGLSPDNQDWAYVPGEGFSRPGLSRLYPGFTGAAANRQMMYEKTYIKPDGGILTLTMDSQGAIYVEDVTNNPGANPTPIGAVSPGLYAQSASAFGREYIAFSDLLHGQYPPLQYNGKTFERVTQDGPGNPLTVANIAPPTATIANTGPGTTYAISSITPSDPVVHTKYNHIEQDYVEWTIYTTLTIVTTAPTPLTVGTVFAISGATPSTFNYAARSIQTVVNPSTFKIQYNSQSTATGTGGTITVQNPSIIRANNTVTVVTASAHGFQTGWQVQILIANVTIGGGISFIQRDGNGTVLVQTATAHGLAIGSQVAVIGVTPADLNGNFPAASVPNATQFTFSQGGAAVSGSGGNVQDVFNVTAFIQSVPSPTTFTYANIGPNDFTNTSGTATVIGQISPGPHKLVQMFLTDQGAITRPSPPVVFYSNGGQQALVSGLLPGPPNVVARIIGCTGAGGDSYRYIPTTPEVGGQITGTSTVVNDNVTSSIIIDFADNTLFQGIAIDTPGNDLFDQRVLAAPIAFYSYASRLICHGDYNKIENLLNMTMSAGTDLTTTTALPTVGGSTGINPWTNPGNVGSATVYADINVPPATSSQALLTGGFNLSVANNITQITITFNYYYTGGGDTANMLCQFLKSGPSAFGPQRFVQFPAGGGGSAANPLVGSFVFTQAQLPIIPADINTASSGNWFIVATGTSGVHVWVNNVSITVSTSTLIPQGWTRWPNSSSNTGQIISTLTPGIYNLYQMTSVGSTLDCAISQPAFQDAFGAAILQPNTQYNLRLYTFYGNIPSGNLVVQLYSPSQGTLAFAPVPFSGTSFFGFQTISFSAPNVGGLGPTPAVIPPDTVILLYLTDVPAGFTVFIAEMSLIYASQPYTNNIAFASYALNPEGFAQTTGVLGSADDPSPIRCFSLQRNTTLLKTASGTHTFQDSDFEPNQWIVNNLSRSVGACSIRAGDPGQFGTGDAAEDWDITVNQNGLYVFGGGEFWKISQELDIGDVTGTVPTWRSINWAAQHTIVAKNDPRMHRLYILAPINGATQPNIMWVMDYKEIDTVTELANAASLKIGITGKQLSTDKTRKWSRWNISANSAEILVRPGNQREMCFAGGARNGTAYANLYSLSRSKLTDDDYGKIVPYYTTYGFVNHEMEQMLGLGTGRKLVKKITASINGVGLVSIIPLVNSLQNPLAATTRRVLRADSDPSNLQNQDLEWTLGVRGERIFFRIQVDPLPGATDVQLKVQKFIVGMMRDPVAIHRSSAI